MRGTLTGDGTEQTASSSFGLALYIALGVVAGGLYVAFDIVSEGRISTGTLRGAWVGVHDVVDHVLPLFAGALLGVAAHYATIRSRLAQAELVANRAEQLRLRLQKVERDQAVWVLAAAVLHELNNPLHAIGLALDELSAVEDDPLQRADLVARIRAQSDRALTKLRDLRSMRSVGAPELGSILLLDMLNTLANDLGSFAKKEGFTVRVTGDAQLRASADPEYLRTIVENLVDNSFHALRENGGGLVTIALEAVGDRAIVRVSDDGPPSTLDESIFEPLQSTKQRGLGLGLPISRALARSMRGDLRLEGGSSFRLELPAESKP